MIALRTIVLYSKRKPYVNHIFMWQVLSTILLSSSRKRLHSCSNTGNGILQRRAQQTENRNIPRPHHDCKGNTCLRVTRAVTPAAGNQVRWSLALLKFGFNRLIHVLNAQIILQLSKWFSYHVCGQFKLLTMQIFSEKSFKEGDLKSAFPEAL